jgi:hypothetical protein
MVCRSPRIETGSVSFRQAKVREDFGLVHLANLRVSETDVKQFLKKVVKTVSTLKRKAGFVRKRVCPD